MEVVIIVLLAVAAFALILVPLLRGGSANVTDASSDAPVEQEVERYRAALRADTVCKRCGQANPPGSRFCYECGRRLATTDAEEFDGTGEAA